eukprot:jgi/Mesvir1/16827/Mv15721-RA.1
MDEHADPRTLLDRSVPLQRRHERVDPCHDGHGRRNALSAPAPFQFVVSNLSISANKLPDAASHSFTVLVKKHHQDDSGPITLDTYTLSTGAMAQKTVMGVRAAWANVPITPITIALNDVVYVQLSDYTGTNIAVAVQLTSSNLGT